jgi:hypothetical protein
MTAFGIFSVVRPAPGVSLTAQSPKAERGGILMNFARASRIPAAALVVAMTPLGLTLAGPYLEGLDRGSFVSHARLRNWLADGERGLWIQGGNAEWFYARFSAACHGLNSTNSLMFDTGSSGNIDRATSVVLPGGGRCEMQTLAPSAGPPKNRNADVVPEPQTQ